MISQLIAVLAESMAILPLSTVLSANKLAITSAITAFGVLASPTVPGGIVPNSTARVAKSLAIVRINTVANAHR